jgi:hypothetical protein
MVAVTTFPGPRRAVRSRSLDELRGFRAMLISHLVVADTIVGKPLVHCLTAERAEIKS